MGFWYTAMDYGAVMTNWYNFRPIYEIEDAYEESIRYNDNDINRYHYAVHLMHENEFDRALEQVESALKHPDAISLTFRGIKGTILTRQNRYEEAVEDFEFIWQHADSTARLPNHVRKIQGTQFANCRRRQVEHFIKLGRGNDDETRDVAIDCLRIVEQTAVACGWDRQLVDVGIDILREVHKLANLPSQEPNAKARLHSELVEYSQKWDSDGTFRQCFTDRGIVATFQRDGVLNVLMKRSAQTAQSSQFARISTGTVESLQRYFGFVTSEEVGRVYMNARSLRVPNEWMGLRVGQIVTFSVEPADRSDRLPRATFLEMDQED